VSRRSLRVVRQLVLDELDGRWQTPSDFADRLGLGHGVGWLKVALVLERLVNDGLADLDGSGKTVRRFRGKVVPRQPVLVVAFEAGRRPRAVNAADLTEDELARVVDWVMSHNGGRLLLEEWLDRHLANRRAA
jgi:hypothetical protein